MTSQHAGKNNKLKSDIKYYRRIKLTHYLSMFLVVAQSFDKAILGLSTASLGFTFAFLRFINKTHLIHMWLLELSWLLFILAVLFVIVALLFTENHALHRVKFHSSKMLVSKIRIKLKRCRDKLMPVFQYLSAFCFVLAVSLFTVFVWFNI